VTADRFYVRRVGVPITSPVVLLDRRGRRREWTSVDDVVRALLDDDEDLGRWQIMAGEDSGLGFYIWRGFPGTVADVCDL
jgi:hypothetical protein